jgi:hypothetical protein
MCEPITSYGGAAGEGTRLERNVRLIVAASVVVLTVIAGCVRVPAGDGSCRFARRSLTFASAEEIGRQALDYACDRYREFGTTPQVALVRPTTPDDTIALFGEMPLCLDEKLALVILKGDFSSYPGFLETTDLPRPHFGYLGLVFDLHEGEPALSYPSNGEKYRGVLNDPSLPADTHFQYPTDGPGPTMVYPTALPTQPMKPCTYGTFAPTVMPSPN